MITLNNEILTTEEAFDKIHIIGEKVGKTIEELISFMKYINMYVDEQNIGKNDFDSINEVEQWWINKTDFEIFEIFIGYNDLEDLLGLVQE